MAAVVSVEHVAELCTDDGDLVKIAIETLKDFGQEGALFFRADGVEIVGLDHAEVVDPRFYISAQAVVKRGGSYRPPQPHGTEIRLGIRNKAVAAILKRFAQGDRLTIGARPGSRREFYVACRGKGKSFEAEIVTPDVSTINVIPKAMRDATQYKCVATMGSQAFHGMIGDLATSDSTTITFECSNRLTLRMHGEGLFSKSSVAIGGVEEEEEEDDEEAAAAAVAGTKATVSCTTPVTASFATNHLQRISKAKNISGRMTIRISSNGPGLFEYESAIGTLSYLVTQRNEDDIDDPRMRLPASQAQAQAQAQAQKGGGEPPLKRRYVVDYSSDGMEDIE
jgi:hypothetical protein